MLNEIPVTGQNDISIAARKILVIGATGLIGNAITRELIAAGHDVTGSNRQSELKANLAGLSMRVVHGDIDTPGQLDSWAEGQDIVIDAAAPYPLNLIYRSPGATKTTIDYARRRTESLLSSVRKSGSKLVYISTLLAQPGDPGSGFSGFQRRLMRIVHPYFTIKAAIEHTLAAAARQGTEIIIIQPSACLGPFDIKPREQCLLPKLVNGEVNMAASHNLNIADTRDIGKGVIAAIAQERFGETIQLSGHNTCIDDLLARIERLTGRAAPSLRIPAALSVLPSYWAELAWAAAGRPSPLPSLLPVLICEQGWLEESAAQQALGIVPRPIDETLEDTISWYQQIGYC